MNNTSGIQAVNHRRANLYEILQELVREQCGVNCRIVITEDKVSVRTKDLADYYLAKAIIKQRVGKEIVRDEKSLGEPKARAIISTLSALEKKEAVTRNTAVLQKAREALKWALETLEDTDAYLRKVDSENYEKFLNLATDRVAKAKARHALKLLSEADGQPESGMGVSSENSGCECGHEVTIHRNETGRCALCECEKFSPSPSTRQR